MPARIQVASLFFNIEGDTDDLTQGLTSAEAQIRQAFDRMGMAGGRVTDETDDLADSMNDAGRSSVDLAAKIFIAEKAYDAVTNAIDEGKDLAKLGATVSRVEERFGKFAEAAGGSTVILEAFQRGAGGTVDKMSAMSAASALLQQGLVTNAAQMEKTVELATRLGDQTKGATDRVADFSQLLKNQSIQLLDNFGISSGRVRERIKELQEATEGLSREEAFRIAVFEEGQKSLDILGDRVDDMATVFEIAETKQADFRIEMGERLAPVMSAATEQLNKMEGATVALVAGSIKLVTAASAMAGGMGPLIEKLRLTGSQFGLILASVGLLIAAYQTYTRLTKEMAAGQNNINEALKTWNQIADEAIDAGESLNSVVADMAKKASAASEALNKNGNIIEDLAAAFVKATKGNEIMRDAAIQATRVIRDQAGSIEEANRLVKLYNQSLVDGAIALDNFTEASFNFGAVSEESARTFGKSLTGFVESGKAGEIFGKVLDKVGISQEDLSAKVNAFTGFVERAGDAIEDTAPKMARIVKVQEQLEDSVTLGARALSSANAVAREYEAALAADAEAIKAASEAQKAADEQLEKSIELQKEQVRTVQDAITAQLDQAEALKDASETEIARAAIDQLKKAQEAGLISFEDMTQAVVEIQDKFGLADDESRALTLGLGQLVSEFAAGNIAAIDFDDALGLLIEDAKDGIVAFDDIKDQIAEMNKQFEGTVLIVDALTGKLIRVPEMVFTPGGLVKRGEEPTSTARSVVEQLANQQQQQQAAGAQVFIENLNLSGVQDAEAFLASLQSVTG